MAGQGDRLLTLAFGYGKHPFAIIPFARRRLQSEEVPDSAPSPQYRFSADGKKLIPALHFQLIKMKDMFRPRPSRWNFQKDRNRFSPKAAS